MKDLQRSLSFYRQSIISIITPICFFVFGPSTRFGAQVRDMLDRNRIWNHGGDGIPPQEKNKCTEESGESIRCLELSRRGLSTDLPSPLLLLDLLPSVRSWVNVSNPSGSTCRNDDGHLYEEPPPPLPPLSSLSPVLEFHVVAPASVVTSGRLGFPTLKASPSLSPKVNQIQPLKKLDLLYARYDVKP